LWDIVDSVTFSPLVKGVTIISAGCFLTLAAPNQPVAPATNKPKRRHAMTMDAPTSTGKVFPVRARSGAASSSGMVSVLWWLPFRETLELDRTTALKR